MRSKLVAQIGDMVNRLIDGHGITLVIEAEPTFKNQDKPVALDGHHAAYGRH